MDKKVIALIFVLAVIIILAMIYSEYSKNKLERERVMLAYQGLEQYNQAIASNQPKEQGLISGLFSNLLGGLF